MYKSQIREKPRTSELVEYILFETQDGAVTTFANIESNDGPERIAYLAWLEEGNAPEVLEA